MIGDCKVPGTNARDNWNCTVCGVTLPAPSVVVESHLQGHILKLQSELFLSRTGLEVQVSELLRAVKENLERALDAEAEADDLRAAIAELGGL